MTKLTLPGPTASGSRLQIALVAILLGLGLAACSATPDPKPERAWLPAGRAYSIDGVTYQPRYQPGYDQTGIASWYGHPFHGRKTANGETYDMNALTAAHTTLPLGSRVQVTNLNNGRSLTVRINDRGPFVGDRIIDMSRRGAEALGFIRAGTARVRVQLLDAGSPQAPATRVAAGPPANANAYQSTLNQALERGRPGQSFAWRDATSGHYGEIAPLTQPEGGGANKCRNYRRSQVTNQGNLTFRGRACRTPQGFWSIQRERLA